MDTRKRTPHLKTNSNTVNHLLFVTTLYHALPEMNWFTVTNFCKLNYLKQIQETFMDWFAARNIRVDLVLAILAKIFACKKNLVYSTRIHHNLVSNC